MSGELEIPSDDMPPEEQDVEGGGEDIAEDDDLPQGMDDVVHDADDPDDELYVLAREEGIDLASKYTTREEAIRGLLNAAKMVGVRDEYAQIGKWIADNPVEAAAWLKEQAALRGGDPLPEKPPADEYERLIREKPEYDPDWEQVLEWSDGKLKEMDGAAPGTAAKYRKFASWKTKMDRLLATDPGAPARHEGRRLREEYEVRLAELQAKLDAVHGNEESRRLQGIAMGIMSAEKDWMFNDGDPQPGNLTEAGKLFSQYFDQLAADSPGADVRKLVDRAKAMVYRELDIRHPTPPQQTTARAQRRTTAVRTPSPAPRTISSEWPEGMSLTQALMESVKKYPAS